VITDSTGILTMKWNKISNISAIHEEIFFNAYWSHCSRVKSFFWEIWIAVVTVQKLTYSVDIVSKFFFFKCELEVRSALQYFSQKRT